MTGGGRSETLFLLDYTITPVQSLNTEEYDGIVYVSSSPPEEDKCAPESIRDALLKASKVDGALFYEGGLMEVNLPMGRMVYSPTEPLSDYHDVRSFSEAAKKGVKRAVKAKFRAPLLIITPNIKFPDCELVAILGALEALYVNIQYREDCPTLFPKVKNLGVWSSDFEKLTKIVKTAKILENGRIVARDLGDSDPERMTPSHAEEYVKQAFPEGSGINIAVQSGTDSLAHLYPLFGAVNRAASVIERHQGRVILLSYEPPGGKAVTDTLLLVGKGVTYDTGGADIKAGGVMAGMSRDKCGAAAVAGFLKVVSEMKPKHVKVIGALSLVRNSVGENAYVSDEVIRARSGKRVRVGNTDAEGRMIMADVLCFMKEKVKTEGLVNPYLVTIATLTGHAVLTVGEGSSIIMDNAPAEKNNEAQKMQEAGDDIGEPFEISRLHKIDFDFHKGKMEGDDILQSSNKSSVQTPRGHQGPAAFLIMASGLEGHGLGSRLPIKYSHIDIAGSSGCIPQPATGAPVLALAKRFLLKQ